MGKYLYDYGCHPSKLDKRDYKISAQASQVELLPNKFILPLYGEIKNQKQVGSCVAHAAAGILEYHDKGQHVLSTNFIYGIKYHLFNTANAGMYLHEACKIITDYGDPLESDCPGNTEVPQCFAIAEKSFGNEEHMEHAAQFKTEYYFKCDTNNDIKLAIYRYGPVLASLKWFYNARADRKTGELIYNKDNDYGYHGIMIYGWDETGFWCKNSYGKYWGLNGTFHIPYDYPEINDARALIDFLNDDGSLIIPHKDFWHKVLYFIYNFLYNFIHQYKKGGK